MPKGNVAEAVDARRLLIERIASSPYVKRSARLRDLLVYLAERVLAGDAGEIHEQEVGHQVFDRPANYDTGTDNIVRVHASMLRKRLEQYFAAEGVDEPLILEIPKGNYAPVFRARELPVALPPQHAEVKRHSLWPMWLLATLAVLFAASTVYLWMRPPGHRAAATVPARPAVQLLWSQVFHADRPTDIVLDDAAAGLYQELTGRSLTLSNYYDRAYLRNMNDQAMSSIVLRRQTSFAGTNCLWKLYQLPEINQHPALLRFARDYSFRELKANNALLLGNSRSNPWVEPFDSNLGIRWAYDQATGTYYPVDSWAAGKKYQTVPGDSHEGYCSISMLPNLGHSGTVMIIAGTGGSAINAGADFLADEQAVAGLRRLLPASRADSFPPFEALIKVKGRGAQARDANVVVCRTPR